MEKQDKLIKTPFDELTYAVIGSAMASHNALGPGLRENSYQRDLEHRLAEKQVPFEAQKLFDVLGGTNKDTLIGYYIPDFVVAEKIVVEIKALPGLGNDHLAK
jgi:GxxExxY protein